ncbi:MAG: hypothetical protein H6740_10245 [Alphaproteobacteria bacterium]|nr:hypothetical protein [Alphaproteobacteria bacterium]
MWMLLITAAQAGTLPPGDPVERAAAVHISNTGLSHIGDVVEGLVPAGFPVADIYGELECDEGDAQPLTYALSAIDLRLAVDEVELLASDGRLDLTLYINLSSTPAEFEFSGDCTFLTNLEDVCQVQLPTTSVVAHIGIELALSTDANGDPYVDAIVSDPTIDISPIGNPLDDCVLADAIGTLLGQNPEAISSLLLSFVEPELAGLGSELETTLEDALNGLVIETAFGLGAGEVALELYPSALELSDSGLVLGLGASSVPSFISECVAAGEGSEFADAPWPEWSNRAWDTNLEYDAAVMLNKDFVDHVLWGVWATGALCLDVSTAVEGLSLDSSLFANIFGESFAALFDEDDPTPINLVTRPDNPPTIGFSDDGAPVLLQLNGLGLEFSAPMDDRELRLFRVDIEGDVGLDPGLSAEALAPQILIDAEAMEFVESYNELVAPGFALGLADFLPTVLGTVLPDDLLPSMALPDLFGVGIQAVFWLPDDDGQWLGGFILLDTSEVQPLEVAGCQGGSFGCDGFEGEDPFDLETALGCDQITAGCDSGEGGGCEGGSSCSTPGHRHGRRVFWPGWRLGLLVFSSVLVLRRRKG